MIYFEQLHANDGKHELEQTRDEHNVADSLNGHDDALDDVLQSFGSVDGAQRSQHPQHSQDLDDRNGARTAKTIEG